MEVPIYIYNPRVDTYVTLCLSIAPYLSSKPAAGKTNVDSHVGFGSVSEVWYDYNMLVW